MRSGGAASALAARLEAAAVAKKDAGKRGRASPAQDAIEEFKGAMAGAASAAAGSGGELHQVHPHVYLASGPPAQASGQEEIPLRGAADGTWEEPAPQDGDDEEHPHALCLIASVHSGDGAEGKTDRKDSCSGVRKYMGT